MNDQTKQYTFWIMMVVLVILGGVLLVEGDVRQQFTAFVREDLRIWLEAHPILAPMTYMLVYIAGVIAFMPGSVMTMVGGAVFGLIWGFIYTSVASTVAAGCSFLVARYVVSDWIEQQAGERMNKLQRGIEQDGWTFIAVTRMIPFFPYNLLNYMFGLTRIDFWTYLVLTWVCMIPGTVAYVYAGYAIGVTVSGETTSVLSQYVLMSTAAGLVLIVAFLPRWYAKITDGPTTSKSELKSGE